MVLKTTTLQKSLFPMFSNAPPSTFSIRHTALAANSQIYLKNRLNNSDINIFNNYLKNESNKPDINISQNYSKNESNKSNLNIPKNCLNNEFNQSDINIPENCLNNEFNQSDINIPENCLNNESNQSDINIPEIKKFLKICKLSIVNFKNNNLNNYFNELKKLEPQISKNQYLNNFKSKIVKSLINKNYNSFFTSLDEYLSSIIIKYENFINNSKLEI